MVCSYLHDDGFDYPKRAILIIACPLNFLIGSHIKELVDRGIQACSLADDGFLEVDVSRHVYTDSILLSKHNTAKPLGSATSYCFLVK